MRTGLFLIFIGLVTIGNAILSSVGKAQEQLPENVMSFLTAIFVIFIIMDLIDFFKGLSK